MRLLLYLSHIMFTGQNTMKLGFGKRVFGKNEKNPVIRAMIFHFTDFRLGSKSNRKEQFRGKLSLESLSPLSQKLHWKNTSEMNEYLNS